MIHVKTQKGKGYSYEKATDHYHESQNSMSKLENK